MDRFVSLAPQVQTLIGDRREVFSPASFWGNTPMFPVSSPLHSRPNGLSFIEALGWKLLWVRLFQCIFLFRPARPNRYYFWRILVLGKDSCYYGILVWPVQYTTLRVNPQKCFSRSSPGTQDFSFTIPDRPRSSVRLRTRLMEHGSFIFFSSPPPDLIPRSFVSLRNPSHLLRVLRSAFGSFPGKTIALFLLSSFFPRDSLVRLPACGPDSPLCSQRLEL